MRAGERLGLGTRHLPLLNQPLVVAEILLPLHHPVGEVVLLVEEAGDDHCLGHDEEDREHAYTEDKLLQLVSLGAVLLHHGPDLDETEEPQDEEDGADDEIRE